jgi:hypothetical protein
MSKEKARQEAKSQTFETNSPILIDLAVEKSFHDCIGLFNCSEPGKSNITPSDHALHLATHHTQQGGLRGDMPAP